MERKAFLDRVRSSVVARTTPSAARIDPDRLRLDDVDGEEQLVQRISAVSGVVHTPDGPEAVVGIISTILAEADATDFLSWDAAELPIAGLLDRLIEDGYTPVAADVPADSDERAAHLAGYDRIKVGLTGADAAFSESGSIVVTSGPGRGRMASLVPETHIAILRREDIHRSAFMWLADHPEAVSEAANVVFVTGPSRTGDIEMHLNLGVHGPGQLHVILI